MKRHTKAQREAQEIEALKNRLRDILQGSWGGWAIEGEGDGLSIQSMTSTDAFARFMGAVELIWQDEEKPYLFSLNNLGAFDTLASAAKYLHEHGCRA